MSFVYNSDICCGHAAESSAALVHTELLASGGYYSITIPALMEEWVDAHERLGRNRLRLTLSWINRAGAPAWRIGPNARPATARSSAGVIGVPPRR
jgi:gamma-glutamyltranspeptidase